MIEDQRVVICGTHDRALHPRLRVQVIDLELATFLALATFHHDEYAEGEYAKLAASADEDYVIDVANVQLSFHEKDRQTVEGVDPGTRFSIEITSYGFRTQITPLVQSYLKDIGIEATIRTIDFATWWEENLGKHPKPYDIAVAGGGFFGSDAGSYTTL